MKWFTHASPGALYPYARTQSSARCDGILLSGDSNCADGIAASVATPVTGVSGLMLIPGDRIQNWRRSVHIEPNQEK